MSTETSERQSIAPTYNRQLRGDRFTIETRLNDRRLTERTMPDPFVTATVTIDWRDLLRCLLRGKGRVTMIVGGDPEIVEDVCELDSDYLGARHSSRRREWDESLEGKLLDAVARVEEHDALIDPQENR